MAPLTQDQLARTFRAAQERLAAGDLDAAEALFRDVHRAQPKAAEPLFHLGRIARAKGELNAARGLLEQAQALRPKEPTILQALAEVQGLCGDSPAALASHDALIKLAPGHPKPLADKALYLQQLGEFDAADAAFRKALRRAPDSGELYRMWLGSKRLAKGDPLIRKMQQLFTHPKMSEAGRIHLGFALAKAMEETGAHDKVFGYLNIANRLQRKAYPYDPAARDAEVAGIMRASNSLPSPADTDFAPIIVTGMARSGTTLFEQILGAHDAVTAGGELAIGLRLAYGMFGTPPGIAPLAGMTPETLNAFAARYEAQARARVAQPELRITDKSIQNHLILGHLHAAMPRAGLIVVKRDPRDIALSIYKNHFAGGTHRYSNDLADIARYIRSFERIVAFWKERVRVQEVSYDELIAAPEEKARALVEGLGLPWQPQCLEFYKQGGTVKTLSIAQVRRPVYKSSGGAWRRYETEMQPFIEAWDNSSGTE